MRRGAGVHARQCRRRCHFDRRAACMHSRRFVSDRCVLFQGDALRMVADGQTAAFSITSAATDLFMLTKGLRPSSDHNVIVYGASYGTLLVERVMQLGPGHIQGFVLDGVVAQVNHSFAQFDHDINAAGSRFLEKCARNSFCHSKFPDFVTGNIPLGRVLLRIYERLDARLPGGVDGSLCRPAANWTDTPPSNTLRRFLTTLLMSATLRTMIPAVMYRLHRCTREDDHVLTFMQRKIQRPSHGHGRTIVPIHGLVGGDELLEFTPMLYNLIVFSEEWSYPTPSQAEMKRYVESQPFGLGVYDLVPAYCVATNYADAACQAHRPASRTRALPPPFTYARDAYFNRTSTIPLHASVLFLSGTLDPQTEIHHGRAQYAAINGTQKRWIEFPDAPHCTAFQTPMMKGDVHCGVYVVASYVMGYGKLELVNTSCMAKRVPLSFHVPPKIALAYFGTTDAFDGELNVAALDDIAVSLKAVPAISQSTGPNPDSKEMLGSAVYLPIMFIVLAGIVMQRRQRNRADVTAAVVELAPSTLVGQL
ncbi:hypothetical protein, variant [Aphanomyces invadans]|uniref:Peptidase S33 tripeptidyl aminopeptidase-like C-terminal domain-containing protein n=1 Tax=Aphanomyces invadans TaxID=157072 RepID=A0A024UKR7_9STRA|nr:hypothetical protein, variant [Aphanomyces invadans]ETW06785.1 hypothetical protein, variant [Aphanomyces invadans]|eukprot:XP_008864860.1 hypothetical protein, variant [Aphanomyces invadans]